MRADSYDVSLIIIVTTGLTTLLMWFIVFLMRRHGRNEQLLEEKIKNMNLEYEKALLTSQVEMQEKAFKDISREN